MTRSEDDAKANARQIVEATAARAKLATMQSYLQRGRKFEGLSDVDLREQWATSLRDWSKVGMHHRPEAYDDAEAELYLRDQPLPYDMVRQEMEVLLADADRRFVQMTPEERRESNERIVTKYIEEKEREI